MRSNYPQFLQEITPSILLHKSHLRTLIALGCASWLGIALLGCGSSGNSLGGVVAGTANPQVASYTVQTDSEATVTIAFGKTTAYGLETAARFAPAAGTVSMYVAGMQANTLYHMQATVQYADGRVVTDVDHTFTTGAYNPEAYPAVSAATMAGQTPQAGIEMLNAPAAAMGIYAVDLSGNVIWGYDPGDIGGSDWYAPKLLLNGDFIALASTGSSQSLTVPYLPTNANLVREFDLAGNTIRQITMDQLNYELAAKGYNLQLLVFSHDVTVLPDGHWLVLATLEKSVVLNGATTPTNVLGDAIVDLDANLQPV
ncbi:MAG: aryl-sulfate sulfotransferase, partial [Acidobacteriaceae bacterium]